MCPVKPNYSARTLGDATQLARYLAEFTTSDNNVMHTKPDLCVFLKWMIARSGSVITDVMCLNKWKL